MRTRSVAVAAAVAGVAAGLVWWRRRASRVPTPVVQIGLKDGTVRTLDRSDPLSSELEALAAVVRESLAGGV